MARKQRHELAAGVFVVVTVLALLGIVLWLGASGLLETKGQEAVFYVPLDINPGLAVGNSVSIGGLKIGQIESVQLQREHRRVYYVTNITEPGFTVHADSVARVSAGLIGGSSLTVDGGTEAAPLADWDNPVLIIGGLDQIMQNLTKASEQITAVTEQIRSVLAIDLNREDPEALLGKIHAVITNIRTITANIAPETSADTPDTIAARLKSGIGSVDQLASKLQESGDDLSQLLQTATQLVAKIRDGEGSAGKLISDDRLHRELVDTAEQLSLLMEDLRALAQKWKETGIEMKLK
jgi:phospholipid/cholesterol/gamma-HCH transport system substrate-binding protein